MFFYIYIFAVRLNKERVSLITEAVNNRPAAYKQMQKVCERFLSTCVIC